MYYICVHSEIGRESRWWYYMFGSIRLWLRAIHKPYQDNNKKYYIICWIERLCSVLVCLFILFFCLCVFRVPSPWASQCFCHRRIIFEEFKSMNHEKWLNNVFCCEKRLNNLLYKKKERKGSRTTLAMFFPPISFSLFIFVCFWEREEIYSTTGTSFHSSALHVVLCVEILICF